MTFFTVAGPISAYTHHQPFSYAAPDDSDESRRIFRSWLNTRGSMATMGSTMALGFEAKSSSGGEDSHPSKLWSPRRKS